MVIDINKMTLENLNDYEKGLIQRCVICGKEFKIGKRKREVCSSRCSAIRTHRRRKKKNNDLLGE